MSIKIQEFSQKISLSIKNQDFPEQNLKQDPRMGKTLEFEQDSRQYLYLIEYQFKLFIYYENIQCHICNLSTQVFQANLALLWLGCIQPSTIPGAGVWYTILVLSCDPN